MANQHTFDDEAFDFFAFDTDKAEAMIRSAPDKLQQLRSDLGNLDGQPTLEE